MKRVSTAEIGGQIERYLEEADNEPLVIVRDGAVVGAFIPFLDDEEERESAALSAAPGFQRILREAGERFARGEWLTEEEFWAQVEPGYQDEDAPAATS